MKTTYSKPQVEIIEVETNDCLMADSLRGNSIPNPNTGKGKDDFKWDEWGK